MEEPDTSLTTDSGTKEVGVMCDLIPSPPLARYASSLGLDRSARRNHSVLSRPLSPEPRPQRRKSRRHILSSPKEKNFEREKMLRKFSEKSEVSMPSHGQLTVKSEDECVEKLSATDITNTSNAVLPIGAAQLPIDSLKSESECSEPGLLNDSLPNLELRSLESDKSNIKPTVLPVTQQESSYSAMSFEKGLVLRLTDGRLSRRLKQCRKVQETNNKENIDLEMVHLKPKVIETVEENTEMECEGSKIVCESKVDLNVRDIKPDPKGSNASVDLKYKFSCNICSYKSMRKNHFKKHMKLHEKV